MCKQVRTTKKLKQSSVVREQFGCFTSVRVDKNALTQIFISLFHFCFHYIWLLLKIVMFYKLIDSYIFIKTSSIWLDCFHPTLFLLIFFKCMWQYGVNYVVIKSGSNHSTQKPYHKNCLQLSKNPPSVILRSKSYLSAVAKHLLESGVINIL